MRPSYLQACYLVIEGQEKIRQVYAKFMPWDAESQDAPLGSDLYKFGMALQEANASMDKALENSKNGDACERFARKAIVQASAAEALGKELNTAAVRLIRANRQ